MNHLGQVLLGIRKEDGIATPPGGHAEDHETPQAAAVRELYEETALIAHERDLQTLPTIDTVNGRVCHSYLWITSQNDPTPKLDPDKEVVGWAWYDDHHLPKQLEKDPRRHESVRNAFMKFHGITKGGPGSGPKPGRIQKQPWDESTKDTPEYDVRVARKKEAKIKAELDKLKAEYKATYGKDYVAKGGAGSGVKGHTTAKQQLEIKGHGMKLVDLANKLVETNPFKEHLHKLENGAIFEGHELRSGKPLYLSVDQAMAHGYSPDDYKEAGSFHYEKSQNMSHQIEKIKALGKTPPAEMEKIVKFHQKQFKQNFNMAEKTHKRMSDTEAAISGRKKDANAKAKEAVKKSVVSMGLGDSAEVDTSKFALEQKLSQESHWAHTIHEVMNGFQYGDAPRVVMIDAGDLHLVKVDDGMYSGYLRLVNFVDASEGGPSQAMEDNAKVRIERMTVPSLIQFLMAKEFIHPPKAPVQMAPNPIIALTDKLNESMTLEPLSESMAPPMDQPVVVRTSMGERIRMLELIDKLLT